MENPDCSWLQTQLGWIPFLGKLEIQSGKNAVQRKKCTAGLRFLMGLSMAATLPLLRSSVVGRQLVEAKVFKWNCACTQLNTCSVDIDAKIVRPIEKIQGRSFLENQEETSKLKFSQWWREGIVLLRPSRKIVHHHHMARCSIGTLLNPTLRLGSNLIT